MVGLSHTDPYGVTQTDSEVVEEARKGLWKKGMRGSVGVVLLS
jgi:hypothetical protein